MRQENVFSHDNSVSDASADFESLVLRDSEIVKPILKEKFLKDYIFGVGDSEAEFRLYCSAFRTESREAVRVILLKPKGREAHKDLIYIRNAAECFFDKKQIILSSNLTCSAIMIIRSVSEDELDSVLHNVVSYARKHYESELLAVYSEVVPIMDIPEAYKRLRRCVEYAFYAENPEVMCENTVRIGEVSTAPVLEYTGIEEAVSGGDEQKAERLIDDFFAELEAYMPAPAVAKTYCLELYVCIIRCCDASRIDVYMKGIVAVQKGTSFGSIKQFIKDTSREIARANAPEPVKIYSSLIKDTMSIIDKNIGNEKLSLRWIAGTILYTNVDYLGKIFKKETGKNFSHYVMEKRMEFAKELIMRGKKDRIYEVAEKVGYGTNSQYFSQVFKKYTGMSPLEYKEITRTPARKTI
ncbi:MAG: helix-turn-helix domain-containing protein [Oscillospiraceae bacterium]|nr:helix-turn-helix domain-containing protein [Oscillospiraceae bacterium]